MLARTSILALAMLAAAPAAAQDHDMHQHDAAPAPATPAPTPAPAPAAGEPAMPMDHGAMQMDPAMPMDHDMPMDPNMPMDHGMMAMDHGAMAGGHDEHAMTGALGAYPASRDASGTAWQPDSSDHGGIHVTSGDWMLMGHALLNGVYSSQGGPRGDDKAYVAGMVMAWPGAISAPATCCSYAPC